MPLALNRWWSTDPAERFWLETTDREDLGANLATPQTNDKGEEFWGYSLIREVRPGDVVFHYHKPAAAIVAWSRAVGECWDERIRWAARGTSARQAGVTPYDRRGWRLRLENFTQLQKPFTLQELRSMQSRLTRLRDELQSRVDGPLYLPLELSPKRPLRLMQAYLAKFPLTFVTALGEAGLEYPSLPYASRERRSRWNRSVVREGLGESYRPATEEVSMPPHDPFSVDPAIIERGLRGHAATQNALAEYIRTQNLEPRSPRSDEPSFDLAWLADDTTYVAEVKSITEANEEKQLRLGVGQVLRYRQLFANRGHKVVAVLAVERRPTDPSWCDLCKSLQIRIVWPDEFSSLLAQRADTGPVE